MGARCSSSCLSASGGLFYPCPPSTLPSKWFSTNWPLGLCARLKNTRLLYPRSASVLKSNPSPPCVASRDRFYSLVQCIGSLSSSTPLSNYILKTLNPVLLSLGSASVALFLYIFYLFVATLFHASFFRYVLSCFLQPLHCDVVLE